MLTHGCALSNLPLFVAAAEGIFERHGLEVTLQPIDDLSETGELMRSGESDLGTAAFPQALIDAEGPHAPVVVAGSGLRGLAVLVRGTDVVPRPGMRVGTFRGDPMEVLAHDWVQAHGIDWSAVTVEHLGSIQDALDAWADGRVDALSLAEPYVGRLVAGGATVATDGTDLWAEDYPDTVLVASRDLLERDPAAVRAAMAAMREAEDLIARDRATAVAAAASWYPGVPVDELVAAVDRQPPRTDIRSLRRVILDRWPSLQSLGLVDATAPAPDNAVDFSLLAASLAPVETAAATTPLERPVGEPV